MSKKRKKIDLDSLNDSIEKEIDNYSVEKNSIIDEMVEIKDKIELMFQKKIPKSKQVEILKKAGLSISLTTFNKFLEKYMPEKINKRTNSSYFDDKRKIKKEENKNNEEKQIEKNDKKFTINRDEDKNTAIADDEDL